MTCDFCGEYTPAGASFCPACGHRVRAEKPPKRANGTGCAYKRGKTWYARIVTGYDAQGRPRIKSKGGFSTKRQALDYLPYLAKSPAKPPETPLRALYEKWLPTHQASRSTINCYKAAWHWFESIADLSVSDIDVDDLQDCINDCPRGKQTRRNMKTLIELLYKYAIPRHIAALNLGAYLSAGEGAQNEKAAIPLDLLPVIRDNIGIIPFCDFIYCQCYTGFRPSEFLALRVSDYDRNRQTLTGGAKTAAGKGRTVTISPKISAIVARMAAQGPFLFSDGTGGALTLKRYREGFYAALDALGVDNPEIDGRRKYSPHSCRHTFANLIKQIAAPDKDKLELIGHSSTEMLRYYQSVDIDDLKKITDKI